MRRTTPPSHPALETTKHRPWPLPTREWVWRQSWLDLAFVHYRIDAAQLRPHLPSGLRVQEFDGSAWLGVVPFRMSGVMRRPFPDIPFFSSFPELNLRTYVEKDGKPGVWFFSLDADSWAIVTGGRALYQLPYFRAEMHQQWRGNDCHFHSARANSRIKFSANYHAEGDVFFATHGTFEHWATERYCLYSGPRATRLDVHHAPWPLQRGHIEIARNDLFSAVGLAVPAQTPLCHYSSGVHVISYAPEAVI